MVDFQSRDTRRGPDDEDDEDEADEPTGDGADAAEAEETDEQAAADDAAAETTPSESEATAEADPDAAASSDPLADQTPGHDSSAETTSEADTGQSQAESAHDSPPHGGHDQDHVHGHDHSHGHDHDVGHLGVAVVTVTSTRTRADDPSGDAIASLTEEADHEVVTRDVVGDDLDGVQRAVLALTGRDDVDFVVTTGGTGVTPDDVTVEAVEPLFDKHLPGFGELFRILSYEEVGTRAMASRATAGVSEGVPVFCLPGSEAAVSLAMEELVLEEVEHLVGLANRE